MANDFMSKIKEYFETHIPSSREQSSYIAHVEGVYRFAIELADKYNADKVVLEAAAWLHDIGADAGESHAEKSVEIADKFLNELQLDSELKSKILSAIRHHSMALKGEEFVEDVPLEDKLLRDADGLSFVDNSGIPYLEKYANIYGDLDKAKEATIKKIEAMAAKITTNEGIKIASEIKNKSIDAIKNYKLD